MSRKVRDSSRRYLRQDVLSVSSKGSEPKDPRICVRSGDGWHRGFGANDDAS
jgi:hypothetical protein